MATYSLHFYLSNARCNYQSCVTYTDNDVVVHDSVILFIKFLTAIILFETYYIEEMKQLRKLRF
jgi:hypothetical protein